MPLRAGGTARLGDVNLPCVGRVNAARARVRLKPERRAQLVYELARGLWPVGAILLHRARDCAAEGRGYAGRDFGEQRARRGDVLLPEFRERAPAVRLTSRDKLEEDD